MAPGHIPGLGSHTSFKHPIFSYNLNCISLQVSTCPSLIGYLTRVAFCLSIMELLTMAKKKRQPTVPGFAEILAGLMSLAMNNVALKRLL